MDEGFYLTKVVLPDDAPERVYLTRDASDDTGELSRIVEVWAERPAHVPVTDETCLGALWMCETEAEICRPLLRVELEAARKFFGTVPDTARECIAAVGRVRRV